MNRIDRLTGILLALQTREQTAQQLADRFEVSRRTILRDVDALSQLHVPVIAVAGPGGGYRLPADYSMPPIHLTPEQATIMLLALSSLDLPESTNLGAAHRDAREKVLAVLNRDVKSQAMANLEHFSVMSDTETVDDARLQALRDAAAKATWVEIEHRETRRTILPELVYLAGNRWYVRSNDALRSARRTFRIGRIAAVRPTAAPTNAGAAIRDAMALDGRYHDSGNPQITAKLTPRGKELALDHPDFRDHVEADGVLRFRCPEAEIAYYGRELLRFGAEAMVESPPTLLSFMIATLQLQLRHLEQR